MDWLVSSSNQRILMMWWLCHCHSMSGAPGGWDQMKPTEGNTTVYNADTTTTTTTTTTQDWRQTRILRSINEMYWLRWIILLLWFVIVGGRTKVHVKRTYMSRNERVTDRKVTTDCCYLHLHKSNTQIMHTKILNIYRNGIKMQLKKSNHILNCIEEHWYPETMTTLLESCLNVLSYLVNWVEHLIYKT